MKNCGTCFHWTPGDDGTLKRCGILSRPNERAQAVGYHGYAGTLLTSKDFGCSEHKPATWMLDTNNERKAAASSAPPLARPGDEPGRV